MTWSRTARLNMPLGTTLAGSICSRLHHRMIEKHVERWRALGPRAALRYYLGTALLERAGVEIVRVFDWDLGDAAPPAPREGESFEVITGAEQLTARDRELLDAYGGASLWATFEQAFAARWRCVVARVEGELACVCWL